MSKVGKKDDAHPVCRKDGCNEAATKDDFKWPRARCAYCPSKRATGVDKDGDPACDRHCVGGERSDVVAIAAPGAGIVVGESGLTVREGEDMDTPQVKILAKGSGVVIKELRGRQARIIGNDAAGWGSATSADGTVLIAAAPALAAP